MDLDDVLPIFFVEARELLGEMEAALLHLEQGSSQQECINAVFRAAHTIKGSAGIFGLDGIVSFTHRVESALDLVRGRNLSLDGTRVELLLACGDHIGRLVSLVESGKPELDADAIAYSEALVARLERCLPVDAGGADHAHVTGIEGSASGSSVQALVRPWHISVRFGQDVLRHGMDPLSFIRYLGTLGRIEHIVPIADNVPGLEALDPESCHLGFEIDFASDADQATIEDVFGFVADDCVLKVTSRIEDAVALNVQEGVIAKGDNIVSADLSIASPPKDEAPVAALTDVASSAAGTRPGSDFTASTERQSVRVDADKLDRLIDLVGELITASATANVLAKRAHNAELLECNATLSELVENVRDSALQLRMVKIGATFGRFRRVVRDVARELGKEIELRTSGEETELDKTVVEKIGDPLMHLVRNAMDHGIEARETRLAHGKPARGTVSLNAYHDSGSIVIEVSDDGGGLSRDKILAKAIALGLVEAGKPMTDAEINALIFEPGFSTADQVTKLSGRGVGMDVVKRNIAALRGTIDIASELGRGTTVTVRLPLTLAIINGFQVGVGKSVFVVPLEMVDECVEFSSEPGCDYTDLRGEVLPFIRLRTLFDIGGVPSARQNIVVIKHAGVKVGIVVDALMGEAQTVIKPLSKLFSQVRGVSGSSILGSGEVALILDVAVLLQEIQRSASSAAAIEVH